MSARLLSRTRNLTSPCTCSPLYRLTLSSPSPSPSTSTLQPFSTSTTTSNPPKDDQWKPLRPPANRKGGLSEQKIWAQDRQRERLTKVNLDKPKYSTEERGRGPPRARLGPRPVRNGEGVTQGERLVRSARAVGVAPNEIGGALDQHRDKSRKWKSRAGSEGPNDLPQFKGGGIGSKMVPGRINRSMQGQERKEQAVGRIGGGVGATTRPGQDRRRPKQAKVLKKVALPSALRLDNLCNILKMKLCKSSLISTLPIPSTDRLLISQGMFRKLHNDSDSMMFAQNDVSPRSISSRRISH